MNAYRCLQRVGLIVTAVVATAVFTTPANAQTTTTWQSGNWLTGTWSNGVAGPNDTAVIGNALTMNVSGTVKQVIMGMSNANQSLTIATGGSFIVDGGVGEFNAGATAGAIIVTQTNPAAANVIQAASVRARGLNVQSPSAGTTAYLTIAAGQLYSPNNGTTPVGNVLIGNTVDRSGHITLSGTLDAFNMTLSAATGSGTGTVVIDGGTVLMTTIVRAASGTATVDFRSGRLAARTSGALMVSSNAATPLQIALGTTGSRLVDSNGGLITMLPNSQFVDGGGAGSLTKSGLGTLVLQAANTYTGDTVITSGTLRVESVAQQVLSGSVGGSGNKTISGLASTAGLFVGQAVTGSGITSNSYITALTGTSVTVSGSGAPGAVTATFAAANGTLQGTTLNYDNQGGVVSFGQSTAITLGGLKGSQNLALTNAANTAVTLTVGGNNQSTTYGGILSGAGSLIKQGTDTFTLSGNNTFTGATSVATGTLTVNGSLANTSLTVAAGATLMGTGAIAGTTTISGMHRPGNSPGIQTFSNLTYSGSTAAVTWELWGNTTSNSPLAYDQIDVTGDLTFASPTSLYLTFTGTGSSVNWTDAFWDESRSWVLYSVDGTTTGFGNLSLMVQDWQDGSVSPQSFNTVRPNSVFTLQQSGNDVVVAYTIMVPEPGSLGLAALGCVAAGWALRRRHAVTRSCP